MFIFVTKMLIVYLIQQPDAFSYSRTCFYQNIMSAVRGNKNSVLWNLNNSLHIKKVLGDNCVLNEECTGTPNAGICIGNQQDSKPLICQCTCNYGFMRYNGKCLQVSRKLYEDCEINDQCNGKLKKEALICREIGNRKVCTCNLKYYVVDNEYLECRKAKRGINTTCRIDKQCTGTENANKCFVKGMKENEKGVCRCNDRFNWMDGKCLKIGIKLFEPCVNNKQCNGTDNAGNCTEIGNNTVCYCQDKYFDFKGRCIKGSKDIGEECEANIQCTGTEHASKCGENKTCTCDKGFIRVNEGCVPDKENLPCFSENQLILIAIGGLFGMIACPVTLFFALKRRKSKTTRLECCNFLQLPIRNVSYSVADNSLFGNTDNAGGVNQQSYIHDQADNIYDEAPQVDQDNETENVYSFSEPQCYHRQEKDSDNDTYNHLHQRPLQMSDDTYGVSTSILIPLS